MGALSHGPETRSSRALHGIDLYSDIAISYFPVTASGPLQSFKAEFFKALAHPVRIRILEILVAGDRSVQELQDALDLDQPTVSQQLAILRSKNVVVATKVGTSVRYKLRDQLVGELLDVARRVFNNQLVGSQSMLRELKRERSRR